MPWRVQTFWLAGSRTGKRAAGDLGSRARCRHQGPAADKCRRAAPSPGQLPVPGIADLASLAMRRLCEHLEAGEAAGRPASAPAGHMPIRSASASRPSPSCSAGLTAAGHPGGPGIPSRIGGNGPAGCPAPGHDGAGRSCRPASLILPCCQPTCSYSVPFTVIPFPRSPWVSDLNWAALYWKS